VEPLAHGLLPEQEEVMRLLKQYDGGPVGELLLPVLEFLLDLMRRLLENDGDILFTAYPPHEAHRVAPLHHLAIEAMKLLPEHVRGRVRVEQLLVRHTNVQQRSAVPLDQRAELLDLEAASLEVMGVDDFGQGMTIGILDDVITTGDSMRIGRLSRYSVRSFLFLLTLINA
jgi:hypothetical protein